MNIISKVYSTISKFNNFIELKRNCVRVNIGRRRNFIKLFLFGVMEKLILAKDANLDLIMVGGLRLECVNCKREQTIL